MKTRHIKLLILLIILLMLKSSVAAQESNTPKDTQSAEELKTFTIGEKRFGGAMAEDGTWMMTSRLSIEDTPEGTQELIVQGSIEMHSPGLAYHADKGIFKGIFFLLIGERVFDEDGDYKYGRNILSSGFLTETGLPVEGILNRIPTDIFGGNSRHPINHMLLVPLEDLAIDKEDMLVSGSYLISTVLDPETPHGHYRFIILPGIQLDDTHFVTLRNEDPIRENLTGNGGTVAHIGLGPVGNPAPPHLPWVLLPENLPSGGEVARHDKQKFALTNRGDILPRAIIPPIDPEGGQIRYRLEPALPFLADINNSPLPLEMLNGELSVSIKTPDNHTFDLGSSPIFGWDGPFLSTGKDKFNFAFSEYGHHEIEIKGHIHDRNGVKIYGGGIYDIYVAKLLDIRPVLKTGMPVKVKESLDLSLRIIPPVPAKIEVEETFNPRSIQNKVETNRFNISCDQWGIYTPPPSSLKKRWTTVENLRYTRDGEYRVDLVAEYRDDRGILYMGAKTLAGIVHRNNLVEIRGENPDTRRTYPQGNDVFTLPPGNDELIAFPPNIKMVFDPDLRIVLTDTLRDERILIGEKGFDLPDGAIGVLPRSTAEEHVAHWYPEKLDRKMYSYVSASTPDGRSLFVVKDGGPMTEEIAKYQEVFSATQGDYFQVYGSMVFRDYPMDKVYYGICSSGAFLKNGIAHPTPVPVSQGHASLSDRPTPFMHSFTFFPGAIVGKDSVFTPRFYVFPPMEALATVTITYPNGEKAFVSCEIDDRGFMWKFLSDLPKLWQEGVYTVKYSLFPDVSNPDELDFNASGTNDSEFSFYVLNNSKSNKFSWDLRSGSSIETDKPLTLVSELPEDAYTEGTVYYCLSFNGDLIEEKSMDFEGNGFDLTANIPGIIERFANFDPKDVNDVLEIGCLVKGVNPGGKNRFMANRITIRSERLEY